MLQVEYRAEPHIFMIPESRGIRKKYFKKLKKISKKNYLKKKKLLPNDMLRCSDRAEPSWIERPQTSTSTLKKKIAKKNLKMTEKNHSSLFSSENAEQHVTGGITCRTAYIHDPWVKGHQIKYLKKLKKISKKNFFFQKKTLAERHVTLFGSRRTVMNCTSPDLYINPEKKLWKKN